MKWEKCGSILQAPRSSVELLRSGTPTDIDWCSLRKGGQSHRRWDAIGLVACFSKKSEYLHKLFLLPGDGMVCRCVWDLTRKAHDQFMSIVAFVDYLVKSALVLQPPMRHRATICCVPPYPVEKNRYCKRFFLQAVEASAVTLINRAEGKPRKDVAMKMATHLWPNPTHTETHRYRVQACNPHPPRHGHGSPLPLWEGGGSLSSSLWEWGGL